VANPTSTTSQRTIGLWSAAGAGVDAIVGGGILVLAGVAYLYAGPAAVIAFAINGVIALMTAMSFAELSTTFPQSGGAYQFAKKAMSVRAAFAMGWTLYFAYIVAGVVYALGFGSYAAGAVQELAREFWLSPGNELPGWLQNPRLLALGFAVLAVAGYTFILSRKVAGGGRWATVVKIVVFLVLIAGGIWALSRQPAETTTKALTPFMPLGAAGVLAAMGFTFLTLQGFDLIAAVAGEIREPRRTIPRAMFIALGSALAIYLPLIFLIAAVGTQDGNNINDLAEQGTTVRATIMARGAQNFMGRTGYWLVTVAALLATLAALQACMMASSRVAHAMATDRTLPRGLSRRHQTWKTPLRAIIVSAVLIVVILLIVPTLDAAGAAASLIFLISFAMAHGVALLVRRRVGKTENAFQTPLYPLVPLVGGLACTALALYQGVAEPTAGLIVLGWLLAGGVMYLRLFARRAEAIDAFSLAHDPELLRLRGHRPLVLTPIANPDTARSLVGLAHALAPARIGRVILLTVVRPPPEVAPAADGSIEPPPEDDSATIRDQVKGAQAVMGEALGASIEAGRAPEALLTIASEPWSEITRVARLHACEVLLLGLAHLEQREQVAEMEAVINSVNSDVVIMRAAPEWRVENARRILVPVSAGSMHYRLRSRLLGSLCRTGTREIVFVEVLPLAASPERQDEVRHQLALLAEEEVPGAARAEIVRADDVADGLITLSTEVDLVMLGLQRLGPRHHTIGSVASKVVGSVSCPVVLISSNA
jgi:amino acid transporter/nucleotide-binding universal stress UspA family protein